MMHHQENDHGVTEHMQRPLGLKQRAGQGQITSAEMILLQKLDLAELQLFEEARELSVTLLKRWLVKYKFKDWTVTETRGQTVDATYKEARAQDIANALSDHQRWHSHGKGISMSELQGDGLKLKIKDFGTDADLSKLVRGYFDLLRSFIAIHSAPVFVHAKHFC